MEKHQNYLCFKKDATTLQKPAFNTGKCCYQAGACPWIVITGMNYQWSKATNKTMSVLNLYLQREQSIGAETVKLFDKTVNTKAQHMLQWTLAAVGSHIGGDRELAQRHITNLLGLGLAPATLLQHKHRINSMTTVSVHCQISSAFFRFNFSRCIMGELKWCISLQGWNWDYSVSSRTLDMLTFVLFFYLVIFMNSFSRMTLLHNLHNTY